ncbi:transcriptional regulator [Saccharopolyspora sp. NFXS83]|uniref:GbsR/MarR family transcriptional regulator n=1 Tax=Saccharopolyspora sp. NFXS83 TaxID=2993560 RepID=UPI00224B6BDF|nr:transcriptional regulator [Saccharopolyspora sp. NFXS83]MCX2734085.1 transcriptional regulator [Saccharopolyspora sp. NFXS83]
MTEYAQRTDRPAMSEWIEQMAAHFEATEGMPLIAGRILAFLLICDPPERTAAELSHGLNASSGSISTNVRLLLRLGVISKTTRQGREAALYRVEEQRWPELVRHRMQQVTGLEQLTEEGLRMFSGQGERARRLRTVHEFYKWLAGEMPELWQRWEREGRRSHRF